jgi:hypothetical protein
MFFKPFIVLSLLILFVSCGKKDDFKIENNSNAEGSEEVKIISYELKVQYYAPELVQ